MKQKLRASLLFGSGTLLGTLLGVSLFAAAADLPPILLDALRNLTEAMSRIRTEHVDPIEDGKLVDACIVGMVKGLDSGSSYLDVKAFEELRAESKISNIAGIGVELTMRDGALRVLSPLEGTPSYDAGLKTGDVILAIDGQPTKGEELAVNVRRLRGKAGTTLILRIAREGEAQPISIPITRAIVRWQSVKSQLFQSGIGYARISQLDRSTEKQLLAAIENLQRENGGALKGFILDLRHNPGGVLTAAVAVSDAFISKGLLVYTHGRVDDSRLKFNASEPDVLSGVPMVVLVNGGTAAGSEIIVAALKDHGRATIMGAQTFGGNTLQTMLPMSYGAALKLTTARLYSPNGNTWGETGITPDVAVSEATAERPRHGDDYLLQQAIKSFK